MTASALDPYPEWPVILICKLSGRSFLPVTERVLDI